MLSTLESLKKQLYIPEEDLTEDENLTFFLLTATDAIEKYCNRKFEMKTYNETHSGRHEYLALRHHPITSIQSITDEYGDITDYTILDGGILFKSSCFPSGQHNITIEYEGGYVLPNELNPTIPKSIEMACLMFSKMMYKGEWGKVSERIDNYSATFAQGNSPNDPPPVVMALCDPYVWRLG